jgi:arylsulfatase A-like enzyme
MTEFNSVVLITIDCLRYDNLGFMGYKIKTPVIDNLAKNGLFFSQAIANGTNTSSSFPSILSSSYSSNYPHKVLIKGDKIRPHFSYGTTLSEILSKNGFITIAIHSNPVITICNFTRGFKFHKEVISSNIVLEKFKKIVKINYKKSKGFFNKLNKVILYILYDIKPISRAEKINEVVYDILKNPIKKPLFLWLHYTDSHDPYSPENYWPFSTILKLFSIVLGNRYRKRVEKYLYDKEVQYCDKKIGELLSFLTNKGMDYNNTLYIITADHGEALHEHNKLRHGGKPYEELIRIPLIMRGIGID